MKFIITWYLAPGNHKPAGQYFLQTGAPMPEGVTMLGRWHTPGSVRGWVLVETDNPQALYEHIGQHANLLDLETHPVLSDEEVAPPLSNVYGH